MINFYGQDDISRQLPGKRDYVTVMIKGVKTQKQKKILLMNVSESEAYQLFKQDHPSIKVGKSKVCFTSSKTCLHLLQGTGTVSFEL